jgi:hypothetical protein
LIRSFIHYISSHHSLTTFFSFCSVLLQRTLLLLLLYILIPILILSLWLRCFRSRSVTTETLSLSHSPLNHGCQCPHHHERSLNGNSITKFIVFRTLFSPLDPNSIQHCRFFVFSIFMFID